jgi:nicotinamide-nucleotide amidase
VNLVDEILAITPGSGEPIDEWFIIKLEKLIDAGLYPKRASLEKVADQLVTNLEEYKKVHSIEDVVIGMSGGIDSALTAALFKQAGWTVHGVTLPIHQIKTETDRGIENIDALRLERHSFDLSEQFDSMRDFLGAYDTDYKGLQRQGNIRARLRMLALYNLAHKVNGCVGSTDNFSELAAGFWTLHGDVGDIAPIQSLSKSWEVPAIASMLGVPQATITALPTDGLGISTSDSDQLGMSYLEFDILLFDMLSELNNNGVNNYTNFIFNRNVKAKAQLVVDKVKSTAYKRANPFNLVHPIFGDRFDKLNKLDRLRNEN